MKRIFETPEDLEKAFEQYKAHLDIEAQKWLKVQYVGKEGERKTDAQKVPMSLEGFEVFCYKNYGCVEQYFKNQGGYYADYVPICSRIKTEIRADQITGGLLGFYNPSITQRLNNLAETQNINAKVEQPLFPD